MNTRAILDLCGGTGSWSQPYRDAGYDVRLLTAPENDVRRHEFDPALVMVQGILAAPPCTVFANSGARWPRTDDEMLEGLSVMDACLRLVKIYTPRWWALENPTGKMARYLGPPAMTFDPADYGDPYTKRTLLWGSFTAPTKRPVEAVEGSKMYLRYGGAGEKTKRERSRTPTGFARAFFEVNP